MLQTIEAVIDEHGKVHLLETVKLENARRALVTILPAEATDEAVPKANRESVVGLGEVLDEDLQSGSEQIAELFNQSLSKSARDLES